MTIRITADTDTEGVSHRYYPDSRFGTLDFHAGGHGNYLYFFDTADIDAVIAELVALKQEMDPPAVPCGKCRYPLDKPDHDEMCEQRAAFLAGPAPELFISGSPLCTEREFTGALCELPLHHDGPHRAPGDDEGDEDVTWSDEAAEVTA